MPGGGLPSAATWLPIKATRGLRRGMRTAKEERCADVPCAATLQQHPMSVSGFHSSREKSIV